MKGRILACFSLSFALAILLSKYVLPVDILYLISAVCFVIFIFSLFFNNKYIRVASVCFIGAAIAFSWCKIYDSFTIDKAREYDNKVVTISATVTDYAVSYDYSDYVPVMITEIDGIPTSINAGLYFYDDISELKPGDVYSGSVKCRLPTSNVNFDNYRYSLAHGIYLKLNAKNGYEIHKADNIPVQFYPKLFAKEIKDTIKNLLNGDKAGFLIALITADKRSISDNLYNSLGITGLSHVVAVSGMHITFITAFITMLIRRKRIAAYISIPIIILYVLIAGVPASACRAAIFQLFFVLSLMFQRDEDRITTLGFALMFLLFINPNAICDVGLQLSFCASLGIYLGNDIIKSFFIECKSKIRIVKLAYTFIVDTISMTLSAVLFTLPLIIIYFSRVSLIVLLSNIIILPIVEIAFIIGIVKIIFSFFLLPLATAVAFVEDFILNIIISIINFLSNIPFASISAESIFTVIWVIFLYLMIYLMFINVFVKKSIGLIYIIVGLLICILFGTINLTKDYVTVLDVGQGQCIIASINNEIIVVDCGGNGKNAGIVADDYLNTLGIDKIDTLVLTHFHDDHTNGVEQLLDKVHIESAIIPNTNDSDFHSFVELFNKYGVNITAVDEDKIIDFSDFKLALIKSDADYSENESGIAVMLIKNGFEALIMGDLSSESERAILRRLNLPDIELLVAGHHGPKYSTCNTLLDALTPEATVISVGYNTFGHPTSEVIERLESRNIKLYRTDINGNIKIKIGG